MIIFREHKTCLFLVGMQYPLNQSKKRNVSHFAHQVILQLQWLLHDSQNKIMVPFFSLFVRKLLIWDHIMSEQKRGTILILPIVPILLLQHHYLDNHILWCDQAKWIWSWSNSIFISLLICKATFYNRTHWNWSICSKDTNSWTSCKTNMKQRNYLLCFPTSCKSVFASSDSFYLITSPPLTYGKVSHCTSGMAS